MMTKIVDRHEKKIYRMLEMLPGILVWAFLLSPIWLGLIAPKIIFFYITFITVFWSYLALKHTFGGLEGYRRFKKEIAIDWMEECTKLNFNDLPDKEQIPSKLEDVRHFILIPSYSEPKEILQTTLSALLEQSFPLKQMTLVFALEEKNADRITMDIKNILGEKMFSFEEVLFFVHPAGIPNEAKGVAGANRTWGAKNAVGHLRSQNKNLRNYIFTTFDADSVLHPQFLARLTHLYLTNERRDNKFFSTALHLFNNNIWKVPLLMRIEANSVTLASLSDWIVTEPDYKETFSCYSSSLQTLIDANYWDVQVGVDDTMFYWRAFFVRNGDFKGAEHYIPYSADAVQADTAIKSHRSMYLQLRRWGWGTIAMPISMLEFLRNTKIPAGKKFRWTLMHLERRVLLLTLVFLMTFGVSLLTLVNQDARQISLVYTLPDIMSVILTITLVFLIPVTILRSKIVKPMPPEWNIFKKTFLTLIEGPMVIINLLTFSLIPFVDAYTRMLFGRKMSDLYHTPKVRK